MDEDTWQDALLDAFKAGLKAAALAEARKAGTAVVKAPIKALKERRKRKVSAYSKQYGIEYKRLKAKHPRMSFGALSKKAHAATRKAMK